MNPESDKNDLPLNAEVVEEAYIWGLPILAMYRYTVGMADNVGGYNKLEHTRGLFEPGVLPGGVNRDTLYSYGWFDLQNEPYVVSLPAVGDRYFVWQMTDVYAHNFHNVGNYLLKGPTERYGSGYTFLMAGRGWEGAAPDGMDCVRAPVRLVNALYRIQVLSDVDDIVKGNRFQDEIITMPLSKWESESRQSIQVEPSSPIPRYRDVVTFGRGVTGKDQRTPEFFATLADVMSFDPPYTQWDQAVFDGPLAALGVGPGRNFDFESLDASTQIMILDAQEHGFDKVMSLRKGGFVKGTLINGWQFALPHHGNWGDHFLDRAYGTVIGGMWPVPNNSTYALMFTDGDGNPLIGKTDYRIRFGTDNLPPVTRFWSITVYESGTNDLYPNDAELYMVGSNNPETKFNEDGSLDIIFAHEKPEDEQVNWLPIPAGAFWLIIRFYAPTPKVLSGEYETPGLTRKD